MKSFKIFFLVISLFFVIVNCGASSDGADNKSVSTSKWIFEVKSFTSGLKEAKLGQQVLFTTEKGYFKGKQFIRVGGFLAPAEKKDKYTFDFKLKLNGKQNIILVRMQDKKGQGFVALGDDARFDRSQTVEFNSNQFPIKMDICFSLPADTASFKFSIDDSPQLELSEM